MKTIFAALLTMATVSSAAYAQEPVERNATTLVKWRGNMTFTSRGAGCSPSSWNPVTDHAIIRFMPSGLGTNGTRSYLTIFYPQYAMGFGLLGRFTSAYKQVDAMDIGGGISSYRPRVRFATQVPAVLTASTQQLTITGQISGFYYEPNCVINFTAAMLRDLRS